MGVDLLLARLHGHRLPDRRLTCRASTTAMAVHRLPRLDCLRRPAAAVHDAALLLTARRGGSRASRSSSSSAPLARCHVHCLFWHSFSTHITDLWAKVGLSCALYLLGAYIYAKRFPECLWPRLMVGPPSSARRTSCGTSSSSPPPTCTLSPWSSFGTTSPTRRLAAMRLADRIRARNHGRVVCSACAAAAGSGDESDS